jgi:hypothetical protein
MRGVTFKNGFYYCILGSKIRLAKVSYINHGGNFDAILMASKLFLFLGLINFFKNDFWTLTYTNRNKHFALVISNTVPRKVEFCGSLSLLTSLKS